MLSLSKKLALLNHNLQQLKKKKEEKNFLRSAPQLQIKTHKIFPRKYLKNKKKTWLEFLAFFFLSVMQRKSGQKELAQGEFSAVEKS